MIVWAAIKTAKWWDSLMSHERSSLKVKTYIAIGCIAFTHCYARHPQQGNFDGKWVYSPAVTTGVALGAGCFWPIYGLTSIAPLVWGRGEMEKSTVRHRTPQ